MAETPNKISNPTLPHSELAREIAARTGHQEKIFSENEIPEAADQDVVIFRSIDEFAKMTEKNVDEWPSLLRKDGNKIKMHFPPGPDQKKFETVLKKFKKKKTEYLLKNEVVITPEQSAEAHEKVAEENRIKNFLDKNSGFEMEIKNKIDDLCNAPTDNSEKTIYENTLFFLEMSFRQLLVLDLKAAAKKGADLQKVAEESTKEWIAALEEMADGPTLEYHELLPQENEVYSPEAWKLVNDPQFRQEAGKLAETATKTTAKAADKKKFVSFYLEQWAEVTEDVNIEGATRFLNESHATMMREVGEGHLSLDEFREVWTEISKNTAAAELLKTAENSSASENFNEWLNDKDEALLVKSHKKAKNLRKLKEFESGSNPHGFMLRKWGSLSSALLFAGRDILGGVILVNFALARFNPIKLLSNPVAWATTGGIAAIVKYFNPSLFEGKTDIKEAAEDNLKNKIETLQEHNPTVWQWLTKFGKNDIAEDEKIGKLLSEEGRTSIASKEIEEFLDEDETSPPEISEKSPEARLLFQFFKACQKGNINPESLKNE